MKQTCVGHLLRNLSEIEAGKTRGAVRFARAVTALLREALALKAEKAVLADTVYAARAADLEGRPDALIDERRRFTDPDKARFAQRLRKHREHLRFVCGRAGRDRQERPSECCGRP